MAIFNDLISIAGLKALFDELKNKVSLKGHDHADLTIKDALGGDKTYNGTEPVTVEALRGEDGISPTITVTDTDGGHQLTIKDKNGTQTVDIKDGAGGDIDVSKAITEIAWDPLPTRQLITVGSSKYYVDKERTFRIKLLGGGSYNNVKVETPYIQHANVDSPTEYIQVAQYLYTGTAYLWNTEFIYFMNFSVEESEIGKLLTLNRGLNSETFDIPSVEYLKKLEANAGGGSVALDTKTLTSEVSGCRVESDTLKFGGGPDQESLTVKVFYHTEKNNPPGVDYCAYFAEFAVPSYDNYPDNVTDLVSMNFKTKGTDGSELTLSLSGSRSSGTTSSLSINITDFSGADSSATYYVDRIVVV